MRVLLVSGSFPPMMCGVGDYTANLAKALERRGDLSVAVLTDVAATPVPADFSFEVFPVVDGWEVRDLLSIATVIRQWRPNLVHVQYPTQGYGPKRLPWLLPAILRLVNVPVVQTWHEYHMERVKRNLINAVLGGGLIAVRPKYKETMPPWFRWLTQRKLFAFIPNGSAIPQIRLSELERENVHLRFAPLSTGLIVYFGFVYPPKGVDLLFEMADPSLHHLVLMCELNRKDEYHNTLFDRLNREPWIGNVTVTGFLPSEDVARILGSADAVVLPFREGGGIWNTSIHAAVAQGSFVLTTAKDRHGYDLSKNIYYAACNDVEDMKYALQRYLGRRRFDIAADPTVDWDVIADAHRSFYLELL
jgi:glycosyltransferase involved in cell wall biosynthesis